jgi:hypothetical protein
MEPVKGKGGRTEDLRMKLDPSFKVRLERLAAMHGMPVATYAAFAIAEFVVKKEREFSMQKHAADQMVNSLGPQLVAMLQAEIESQTDTAEQVGKEVGDLPPPTL